MVRRLERNETVWLLACTGFDRIAFGLRIPSSSSCIWVGVLARYPSLFGFAHNSYLTMCNSVCMNNIKLEFIIWVISSPAGSLQFYRRSKFKADEKPWVTRPSSPDGADERVVLYLDALWRAWSEISSRHTTVDRNAVSALSLIEID